MEQIESVGIREFRANMHKYTTLSHDPIAVTSHGERIGFFIPARPSPQKKDFEALQAAASQISNMLEAAGVTEDEIVAEFDARRKEARKQTPSS